MRFGYIGAATAALCAAVPAQAAQIVDVEAFLKVESVLINCNPANPFCDGSTQYSYPSIKLSFDADTLLVNQIATKYFTGPNDNFSITVRKIQPGVLEGVSGAYSHNYKLPGQIGDYVGFGTAFGFKITGNAIPEPSSWMLMILGFGAVGYAVRRKPRLTAKYA